MSLINDALKRADADKGPRRPAPLGLPPTPVYGRPALAPTLPPAVPAKRESRPWGTIQAAVLGGALVIICGAGVLVWKMVGNSPAEVVASPSLNEAISSAAATLSSTLATQKEAALGPRREASSGGAGSTEAQPKSADPLLVATGLAPAVRDVFAAPPTLFVDARKVQSVAPGDLPLTPTESRTLDVASPARLAAAFTTPAAEAPRPAAAKAAAPAATPAVAPSAPPAAEPAPAPAPAAELPKLKVTSIFYKARAPTAIINGQVTGVGETVEGATVLSITPRSVDVMAGGKRVTLRL